MMLPIRKGCPDDFQTPAHAIEPLLPYLPNHWKIWECAAGKGNLTKAFCEQGYNVVSSDILQGKDFLHYQPISFDCIITNPPFSLKQQFLQRAYELKKPFAFLLPLTTFETASRQQLFKQYGIEVILFDKRINFETPNKVQHSSSWFATAWFTNGLKIGKELSFATLAKAA